MNHISAYDPTRMTVGAIYKEAQEKGEKQLIVGDMNYEMRNSLAVDINDAIKKGCKEHDGRPFYILVIEKRDLQMKNAFIRRIFTMTYRPYPEDDTLVFRMIPYTGEVYFCWELPHRTHMLNMLACPELYDHEQLQGYRRWENYQLEHYGFMKDENGNWKENPFYHGDKLICDKPPQTTVSTA